jgi:hypothetical protein
LEWFLVIISTSIGGAIAVIGNIVTQRFQFKREKYKFASELKREIYTKAANSLTRVQEALRYDPNYADPGGIPDKCYEFERNVEILQMLAPKALNDQIRQFEKRISSFLPNADDYPQIMCGFPDEQEIIEFEKLAEEIFRLMRKDLGLSDRPGKF